MHAAGTCLFNYSVNSYSYPTYINIQYLFTMLQLKITTYQNLKACFWMVLHYNVTQYVTIQLIIL